MSPTREACSAHRTCRRRPTPNAASEGKVGGTHFSGDLVEGKDLVEPKLFRVLAHHLLGRSTVDAKCLHVTEFVDGHVAVFPDDPGKRILRDLFRTPPDLRHL